MKRSIRLWSLMLIMALTFALTACGDKKENEGNSQTSEQADTSADEVSENKSDVEVLGEGEKQFSFVVVDEDGNEKEFEIHTDKQTVGEALLELELIEGDSGEYGLYVKTVNGLTVDYDKDGKYWAFYVNDEYAMSGVDTTNITEGDKYSFKVEK